MVTSKPAIGNQLIARGDLYSSGYVTTKWHPNGLVSWLEFMACLLQLLLFCLNVSFEFSISTTPSPYLLTTPSSKKGFRIDRSGLSHALRPRHSTTPQTHREPKGTSNYGQSLSPRDDMGNLDLRYTIC